MTPLYCIGLLTCASAMLCGCDRFEDQFYERINEAQATSVANKDVAVFNLSEITPFEWDSVLLIRGNESVPVMPEDIEPLLKRKAAMLATYTDRFYFLTSNKDLIIKEIEGAWDHRPAFEWQPCALDSLTERYWLSKSDCVFNCISNTDEVGSGTVFLFPSCLDKQAWSGFKLVKAIHNAQ